MQSKLRSVIAGFSLASIGYIDKPRDLVAVPWPMMSQDAAFWGIGPRFEKKLAEGRYYSLTS